MNLRVIEDDRIVMELPDGAEHVIRNSELIPAYYCLPIEFLDFLKKYGKRLPRKPSQLFLHPEDLKFVESNLFRSVIHEAFARLAWFALGMKGWIGFYSRYAPQWIVAYQTDLWIPLAKELSFMKTNAKLFAPPECESRQPVPSRFDAQEIVEVAIYYEFLGSDLDMILETVVYLSKLKSDEHVKVEVDMSEFEPTGSERRKLGTYEEIKKYILEKYGFKVPTLYISQIKRKVGGRFTPEL